MPGYEYKIGEEFDVVIDPWWEQRNKPRQLIKAVVVSLNNDMVFLRYIGISWENPPINEDPVY